MKAKLILVSILLLSTISFACQKEKEGPVNFTVKASDLIGVWIVDEKAMKDNMGLNPLNRIGLKLYKNMILTFTKNTLTVKLSIMGKSKDFKGRYKVVSAKGNIVKVKALSGSDKGKVSKVFFLAKDQIKFTKEGDDSPPLILKRK